ncbi:hypothetical protein GCM10011571_20270 [Marinithermofilum abyssi]|uniref:Uncharacterized protein n=1 Tax=Marinithermofilum abyssi TaxID=1571185 RepID=A0A8J2YE65_9BACL|nr:hypothetical protein [Marinithermofilum abyssi]GGE18367.1 hypothetical protein GCM10011571_20270 [Marinithermofilum abyssi]
MEESFPLGRIEVETDGKRFPIRFWKAEVTVNAPGPGNLKNWYVYIQGMNAESADVLDDCFYYDRRQVTLHMETAGGKPLEGEAEVEQVAVGPHSHVKLLGRGVLYGFELLM